jgi:hypothetical protein
MNDKPTTQDGWEDAPGAKLATYASFRVGDLLMGQLVAFEMKEENTGKKKKGSKEPETEFRPYLTFLLAEAVELKLNKKENRAFKSGESVKIQGKGNLHYLFQRIAAKREGKDVENDTKATGEISGLVGGTFRVERLEDGTMNKGAFEGNPVQRYDVKSKIYGPAQ